MAPSESLNLDHMAVENRERIVALESSHEDLSVLVRETLVKVNALHEDMIGRRAVRNVTGQLVKYGVWAVACVGSLLGLSQSSVIMQWLHTFPTPSH